VSHAPYWSTVRAGSKCTAAPSVSRVGPDPRVISTTNFRAAVTVRSANFCRLHGDLFPTVTRFSVPSKASPLACLVLIPTIWRPEFPAVIRSGRHGRYPL
jgi:hypothetical protein